MSNSNKRAFLGIGWSFPPRFTRSSASTPGRVRMIEGEDDIASSLSVLFHTALGERFLRPRFGLDLRPLLFDSLETTARTALIDRIKTTLLVHEPRIDLLEVQLEDTDPSAGRVLFHVSYRVRSTNTRFNRVFPFYRDEASEGRESWMNTPADGGEE